MKKLNLLIYAVLIVGAYLYFISSDKPDIVKERIIPSAQPTLSKPMDAQDLKETSPRQMEQNELPEDIRNAAMRPESNNPDDLPADLKAQLNAPPPELPDDLRRQLEMGPQELPPDLKAQLEGPPPPIPDDIKRALAIPPREVSIDEVNSPLDTSDEEVIE